jgi:hypothetical protein
MSEKTTETKKPTTTTRLRAAIEEMVTRGVSPREIETICKAMARTLNNEANKASRETWTHIGKVVNLEAYQDRNQPARFYRALVELRRKFATRTTIAGVRIDFLVGKRAFFIDAEQEPIDHRRVVLEKYRYIPYFFSPRFFAGFEDEDLLEFVDVMTAEHDIDPYTGNRIEPKTH